MRSTFLATKPFCRTLMRGICCSIGGMAVALALAACGGGGGGDAPGAAAANSSTAATAQSAEVVGVLLAQQAVTSAPLPRVAAATSGNMVTNGGFESGMPPWVNWGNASVVSGQASSGTSALAVGTAAGGAGQTVGGIEPGTTYSLTAQARVSTASDRIYVGVNFLDASGAPVKQDAAPVTSTTYTTASLEVVAPPGAVNALIYVWKDASSGLGYVDGFAFGVAGSAGPGPDASGNLVTNGGFDNGLAGWDNWGNTTTSTASGSSAAQVGTAAGGFGQRIGPVLPGTSYRLTAQAKVSTAGDVGYLGVAFADDAGNTLAVQNAVIRSTTASTLQVDATAPAGATKAQVFVWKNDGSGFAVVDDMSLVQTAPGSTAPGAEVVVTSPAGAPVFQLPWGGEVSGQFVASGSNLLRRYAADGSLASAATSVNFGDAGTTGSATVLAGGGYAAAWIVSAGTPTGPSYQLYTQAFNAAAQAIGSPVAVAFTRVADDLGNPAAVPQLAPLTGGGYVVVWALQQATAGGANDRGVYTQRFDADGHAAGPAQQATTDGAGFLQIVGTTSGGYVVNWGKSSGDVGGARAYGADGAPLAGEQVAGGSWHTGAGPRGSMAPLSGGGAAIVWQVRNGPVFVQHIAASGVALPAQVASSLASPAVALVAIAGLPDGGSVVAWFETGGNVYARRYAADGSPLGAQTRVNLVTAPTNGTEIMVLADGSFSIAWDVGSTRYARTFPASGLAGA
jgi:hypothetical protein